MEWIVQMLTFPLRLVGKLVFLIGRVLGLLLGLVLMVVGTALSMAEATRIVGIPLFIVGLLLVLRALA